MSSAASFSLNTNLRWLKIKLIKRNWNLQIYLKFVTSLNLEMKFWHFFTVQRSKFICNRPSLDVYGHLWTIFGRLWTSMDKNGQKKTKMDKMDKNRRLWTSLDKNGQNWTKIDAVHGRPWTSMVDWPSFGVYFCPFLSIFVNFCLKTSIDVHRRL